MKGRSPTFTQVPLDIVGSTKFGRYPKVSIEQTYNMIISDEWLVDYAGYVLVLSLINQAQGRAIYTSNRLGKMIAVIANTVYAISTNLSPQIVGTIATFLGDVFIDEDNIGNIAICDKQNIYIYNYVSNKFYIALDGTNPTLGFIPGYISYQNGRFLTVATDTSTWRLSGLSSTTVIFPNDAQHVGTLQTKPDLTVAVQRFPGRGNLIYVFGHTVAEPWQDIGAALFPYLRNSGLNIDYGCLNPATIAYNETIMVWLAANEKSGPVIAYSTGGDINRISTDGIDFKLTQLTNPSNSYGFLFRQDGHLIYQITFPDDNLTYIYDFNTKKFFTITDEKLDFHIAKRIAFFNNTYYFVSFIDGNIYEMSTKFTTYNGKEIPRIRTCRNIRLPDGSRYVINNITFTIEQGTQTDVFQDQDLLTEDFMPILTELMEPITIGPTQIVIVNLPLETETQLDLLTENGQIIYVPVEEFVTLPVPQTVLLSMSKNGGQSMGMVKSYQLNNSGVFPNRLNFWQLGSANDFVPQFRFAGLGRFVASDGIVNIYQ